jgi:hypothetical protein
MTQPIPGFRRFQIGLKTVPTHESIMAVITESLTYEDTLETVRLSNVWVRDKAKITLPKNHIPTTDGWFLEILKLHEKLNYIQAKQCELVGLNYWSYVYCGLVVSWHESIRGNHQGKNAQYHRKETEKAIFNLTGDGKYGKEMGDVKEFLEYPEAGSGSEFSINKELRDNCYALIYFGAMIKQLSEENQQTKELLIEEQKCRLELLKLTESLAPPKHYSYRCPYCRHYSIQDSAKVAANCGSDSCKTEYSTENKRKNRQAPSSGWVSSGKRGYCSECTNRRLVDSTGICKKCFPETAPGADFSFG